ncbi:MAG: phosphoglucomutase (alpha-D-glucose-1,6-bisphosphate-dependent) [Gammaproteobacteria bacterium]|nr:phosphoglucomutase (alpha-D-glucose-1,6-bisphosphate-dependent) [Gammaproteobacteria bacterium]
MSAPHSPLAGKRAPAALLVDVPRLITAYFALRPDPAEPAQRVAFGTSGHRGVSLEASFNEHHVLAITQAICENRRARGIDGPLFLGFDTHALSAPAFASALEVLAANGVDAMIAAGDEYTPTPAISHAILAHNRGRSTGLADGIVITPSHNPPDGGGFKYNPQNGGPADADLTRAIETRANRLLETGLAGVRRIDYARARRAPTTHAHDFLSRYVEELGQVVDMDAIRGSSARIGVDPLGGAGVHYWARIAEHHRLRLDVVDDTVDPTFRFMSVDWDGRIRMDPSSPYAMQRLLGLRERYDVAFACDTDHDRHGIVTRGRGLLPSNHYLAVAIDYLFRHRPAWGPRAGIGKTIVSSSMIDRVAARLARRIDETPVGFKWFAAGLADGSVAFAGEESAGAAFARIDGSAWTTDKDGIAPALLAAEITARTGRDPGECHAALERDLGAMYSDRVEAPANAAQKRRLSSLTADRVGATELAGEPVTAILTRAPANDAPFGGVKVISAGGWFAARPSGTEDIYKVYAESFRDPAHLRRILDEAQRIVDAALAER